MKKKTMEELVRVSCEEYKKIRKIPVAVVLDNVRSLNNIGSVFRTADAFLIEKIYLCGITATPPSAENSVEWEYAENTLDIVELLKSEGYKICSIEQVKDSISLFDFNVEKDEKYAVIFGHEVKGVQQEVVDVSDYCIELPQYGTKHSLNVAVTAGIVMWEMFSKYC